MEPAVETIAMSALTEGKPAAVFPLGLPVLLIRLGTGIFALENRCAHMGCPLTTGKLEGHLLQCPCHDWRFDIRDGQFLGAPELKIKTYAAEVRDEKIFVRLN